MGTVSKSGRTAANTLASITKTRGTDSEFRLSPTGTTMRASGKMASGMVRVLAAGRDK